MGELANRIIAAFEAKGIPLPASVIFSRRLRVGTNANGVVTEDGGGMSVPIMLMDSAPTDKSIAQRVEESMIRLETAGVIRHQDGRMVVNHGGPSPVRHGSSLSAADAAINDAHAVRDKAYSDYVRSISPSGSFFDGSAPKTLADVQALKDREYEKYVAGLNKPAGQAIKLIDRTPDIISEIDRPDFLRAVADAESDDESRARFGIEQLLAVARTCRARASAASSGEESRNAEAAASYIEALASAAELVLTGKNAKEGIA